MPLELFANAAVALPLPASGWESWAPEVAEKTPEAHDADERAGAMFWAGGALSLLMWGCACLMAAWYL